MFSAPEVNLNDTFIKIIIKLVVRKPLIHMTPADPATTETSIS